MSSRIAAVSSAVLFLMLAACNSSTPKPSQAPSSSESAAIGEASPRRPRQHRELATEEAREKAAKNDPNATAAAPAKQAFPRDDAKVALRAAEGGLRSCRLGHDAWEVEVMVKFEPTSGNVSNVDVTPMRGSRETELFKTFESCVKSRLTEVAVTPFAGNAVTMTVPMKL
jgi:hypothetical protein